MEFGGYVYIITNKYHTVLYTGVTSDLCPRIWQHKHFVGSLFTSRYRVTKFIYYESYPTIGEAIKREKKLKKWKRKWKWDLIMKFNPDIKDLWYPLCEEDDK